MWQKKQLSDQKMRRSGKMNKWNYLGFAIPGTGCVSVNSAAPRLEPSVEYVTQWLNSAVAPIDSLFIQNYTDATGPH